MYLNKLEGKEKEVFLDLAVQTAKVNGMVEEAEKEMITRYCREMSISEYTIYEPRSIDEAAEFFKEEKKWKRRIVIFELIVLSAKDGKIDKKEREFFDTLADKMGIKKGCVDDLEEDVKKYVKLTDKITEDIMG